MTDIKIVQVIIEVDGRLCHAKIPDGMEHMILSLLQANEHGQIQAVKLSHDWKKIPLKDAI